MLLKKIQTEYDKKKAGFESGKDTSGKAESKEMNFMAVHNAGIMLQFQEYEKLINQYQLMVNASPPVLIVVEKAVPPVWHDKPKVTLLLIATAFLSFIFMLFTALLLERKRF